MTRSLLAALAAVVCTSACASAGGTVGGASGGGGDGGGGFRIGAHVAPTTISADEGDDVSGTGFGVMLGYGFSREFALFVAAEGAALEGDEEVSSDATHVDIGFEYAFDAPERRFVPYLRAAYSTLGFYSEACNEFGCFEADAEGTGFSAGGGVRFFVMPALALDVGADFGSYTATTETDFGDVDMDLSSTRFKIGALLQFGRGGGGGGEEPRGGGGPK